MALSVMAFEHLVVFFLTGLALRFGRRRAGVVETRFAGNVFVLGDMRVGRILMRLRIRPHSRS